MKTSNLLHPPLPDAKQAIQWGNLHGASLGLALSTMLAKCHQPVLIMTADSHTAARVEKELYFFQSNEKSLPILNFPDWETLPYDHFSPHQDIISERLTALYKLPTLTTGVVITPIATLMHRLPPKEYLAAHTFVVKIGEQLNIDALRNRLEQAGYYCVTQVREHGEFAVRGSLIDLFPMGSDTPFRIELFDDEIDTIRTFSIETQRTLEKITEIKLLPAKEFSLREESIEHFRGQWRSQFSGNPLNCSLYQDVSAGICPPGIEYYLPFFFEHTHTIFDYLANHCLIVTVGPFEKSMQEFWHEISARYEQYRHDATRPLLPPENIFLTAENMLQGIRSYARIHIQTEASSQPTYQFPTELPPQLNIDLKASQPFQALENFMANYPGRILFCAETTGRREVLLQLFQRINLRPPYFPTWQDFISSHNAYGITVASLEEGLVLEDPDISIIAEAQLFGKRILQPRRRKTAFQDPEIILRDLTELQIGAPIVHLEHGVGRYLGLQTLTVGEVPAEFLTLEYAAHDKLYVPVTALHLIGRYSGADPEHAPLHRLGSGQWEKAKQKAAEQVRDVAAELLDIYAKRLAEPGFAYQAKEEEYAAFAATFPFEETPDQLRAIQDVIHDMRLGKPMDRLVCGDVGFGKTEVAMRAAFIAVQNNKQVAILVPTTLLAQQHFQTFQDRFADWPVQVEVLSRFKSSSEQKNIMARLQEGKVDIIIGTHKLLQETTKFNALGLLIIDEEHRFGVQQKERLKALRASVDILTLTATPIPRTLNMAFAGMRDLSLIATPPAKRLSVKTFVQEYQNSIIHEALLREILRGGQVYFLHNDVATIEKIARDLEKLVPEARLGIAHGQMRETALEQVMSDFYHRRFNVLVCTTIVESGIDIPSANTIIIHRADKFGLAQLHQLRGRVGRSHHQAYAYLLTPPKKLLTADAVKRLDAVAAYEDLGIGFTLATHDLEIRGAGELLGEGQSGNMHEIGFTLYTDLLTRAVDALKSGKEIDLEKTLDNHTEINLQIPALIPDHYLGDVHLRLQFYKRIASTETVAELDDIQVEMIDRFGLLPDPLKNLFAIAELRQQAETLGIKKIDANAKGGRIEFTDKPQVDPLKIITLIQKDAKHFKLDGPTRLKMIFATHENKQRIGLIDNVLKSLK